MTVEEAIEHCEAVAAGETEQGKCSECAADHKQLAEWLRELLVLRAQQTPLDRSRWDGCDTCTGVEGEDWQDGIKNRECPYLQVMDKLAAYEDTELEPEQIEQLKGEVFGLRMDKKKLSEYLEIGGIDHMKELVQAEKDGRLVVLPCKVGDTVYIIRDKKSLLRK